jgi:hypothetical protein
MGKTMRLDRCPLAFVTCFVALTLSTACGGGDAAEEADPSAEASAESQAEGEATPAAAPATDPSGGTNAPLTVADIDVWEKGMAGELEAVQAALAQMKSAKTQNDTLTAMMAVQENATQDEGAKAAGVDLERYKIIRSNLLAAASYMTPSIGGIDTTMLSPAQRDEMRQMNEAQLKQLETQVPPEVLEALRPRAVELRTQSMELVAARLKGAGMQ